MRNKILVGLLFLAIIVAKESVFIIEQAHQGMLVQLGEVVSEEPVNAGLHLKVPFIQRVAIFDKRILNLNSESREVIAADQKRLIVNYYVKYRIVDPVVFYKAVRNEITLGNRLGSIVESQVREQIGSVSLISLLKDARSDVIVEIKKRVNEHAKDFGVVVIDVRIKKADLPEENSEAIFRRMQTERIKEAKEIRAQGFEEAQIIIASADKKSKIMMAEASKVAKILEGKGEGEAAKIFNEAFSVDSKFFDFYRHMEAYKKAFSGSNTKLIIDADNDFLSYFSDMNDN